MKTIQLLHSAAAIPIVVGKEDLHHPHSHNRNLRLHLQLQNCDLAAGETPCHDEVGDTLSCAKKGEECPCFSDEKKCTSPDLDDYCDTVCCEWNEQERCHHAAEADYPGHFDVWCANVADGGCPCFDGEVKCGVMESDGGHSGYCTSLCCNEGEQTCYDENYDPSYCAFIAEGGCSCPQGQDKCGGTEYWAGYCTTACCDAEDEETCYDAQGNKSCNTISEGGCSHNTSYSYRHWESRVASTILTQGTGSQVSYYSTIKNRKKKLLADASPEMQKMIKHLEAEEAALFHAIRIGRKKKLAKEDVTTSIS